MKNLLLLYENLLVFIVGLTFLPLKSLADLPNEHVQYRYPSSFKVHRIMDTRHPL